ncbi:solute carrier family 2, facilitated glucose transporter member 1-like [Gordionus sp. m RMFG-2023]|uniref:solute carrier family 2, facilitated glucose transporter member 1-like n=1 Tax=Gordionus sp. m RMFG-2023 TaxID=3053472 RepID=UPI0031FD6FFE
MDITKETPQEMERRYQVKEVKPLKAHGMTTMLAVSVAVIALSSFQFGYSIGVVNAPELILREWYSGIYRDRHGRNLSSTHLTILWGITVSIFAISGMIGGLLSGYFCDRFGRKGCLLLNNGTAFLAAILMGCARAGHSYEMIIIGRLIIGFNCGVTSGAVPMYLAEISPVSLRGATGAVHQLAITISILFSQILGLPQLLGNVYHWPILLAFTAIPAAIQCLLLPLMPESPRYLLISKNDEIRARYALSKLRKTNDVTDEIDQMKSEAEEQKRLPPVTWKDMFTKPVYRKPLIIASETHISQQLSGINAAMFFSTGIFISAGLRNDHAVYATCGMGAINVLMTLLSMAIIEKAGRRTLYLLGLAGMWLCSILLTITLVLGSKYRANQTKVHPNASYFSVALVIVFVCFFAIGPGVIAWFISAELFTQAPRPKAMSISVIFNWFGNFLVGLLFPVAHKYLHNYVFLVFTVLLVFFWLYTYKFLPETKNKTSEELSRLFMTDEEKFTQDNAAQRGI